MFKFILNWFRKRRSPWSIIAVPEKKASMNFVMPQHLHLHWHVSDITHIPAQFSWHSPISIEFNALNLAPQPTSQSTTYYPYLLDNARTQWQFGDWDSLVKLQRDTIEPHPERAKLALLVAAGHQQVGDMSAARDFVQLARDWGCDKQLISRVLVAGVYNTLGKAAALGGQQDKALGLFEESVRVGMPGGEGRLLTHARNNEQLVQLGLLPANMSLFEDEGINIKKDLYCLGAVTEVPPEWIVKLADDCVASDDVLEKIDDALTQNNFSAKEYFFLFILMSERFQSQNDNLTALSFLNWASEHANNVSEKLRNFLAKKFIELGHPDEATDIIIQSSLYQISQADLSDADKKIIEHTYIKTRISQKAKSEHGHELLLAYLRQHLPLLMPDFYGRKPILIEIGTTRENISGQGSTRKIAEFCIANGLHFITVDMDSHNTHVATNMLRDMESSFEAINMKGEDYLRDYDGNFDFIFLDAYDFDHGKHSKLRQSRYEKFLGAPIDDTECHKMHLDCARYVKEKLSQNGLVCIDDTWLENGNWTAKGTLAMPYLLENGFHVFEARNRAALLGRCKGISANA